MSVDSNLQRAIMQPDPPESPFYIPATAQATRPRRALKHGDTFIVTDNFGDIGATAGGTDGLYHADTRFLSHLELGLNGSQPLLLGSNARDDNTLLAVDLTNPDYYDGAQIALPKDIVHIARTMFLWNGSAYQRLAVRNHGDRPLTLRSSCSSTAISPTCSRYVACSARAAARFHAASLGRIRYCCRISASTT